MATEQDLHQAFINYLTLTLSNPPEEGVDPKLVEWTARYLEKKEFTSVDTPAQGTFEGKAFADIQKQHGVE